MFQSIRTYGLRFLMLVMALSIFFGVNMVFAYCMILLLVLIQISVTLLDLLAWHINSKAQTLDKDDDRV